MYDHESPESESSDVPSGSHASSPSKPSSADRKAPASANVDAVLRCAYCGKEFRRSQSPVMPFCSRRCQQIDLGMWLNESYGMPCEGDEHAVPDEFDE